MSSSEDSDSDFGAPASRRNAKGRQTKNSKKTNFPKKEDPKSSIKLDATENEEEDQSDVGDYDQDAGELPQDITGGEQGSLVYIFRGNQNDPNELVVFSKLCQKYGLQNWEEMVRYLPWRDKASLRTALCHVIMKQALSEYENIRADPFKIREDNKLSCNNNPDYTLKAGTFVNQQWDRTPEDWKTLRNQNYEKYHISDEEAEKIEIPSIVSIEYMKQLCSNRRQSLLLRRAAIRMELARRRAKEQAKAAGEDLSKAEIPEDEQDWGIDDLAMNDPSCLNMPHYTNPLVVQKGSEFFLDSDQLADLESMEDAPEFSLDETNQEAQENAENEEKVEIHENAENSGNLENSDPDKNE